MNNLFATGRIVYYILALMLVETVVLIILGKVTRRGMKPLDVVVALLAGAGLLLALRASLIGYSWPKIAPWLAVSLCAHVIDLIRRWTRTTA